MARNHFGAALLFAASICIFYIAIAWGIDDLAVFWGLVMGIVAGLSFYFHELAHYWAAKYLRANPQRSYYGASVYSQPRELWHLKVISLVGPITGFIVAGAFSMLLRASGNKLAVFLGVCLSIHQLSMVLPIFTDGSLILLRKDSFNEVRV